MKVKFLLTASVISLLFASCGYENHKTLKERLLNQREKESIRFDKNSLKSFITAQYRKSLETLDEDNRIPRNSYKDGTLRTVPVEDWTSGFYAGTLWYIYELTGDSAWLNAAHQWTQVLESIQYYEGIHDIGFMIYCSYGNAYRLTEKDCYLPVLKQTAKTLCKRFNPAVGTLLSWGDLKDTLIQEYHNTIIDNMMNLELLMFASRQFEEPGFADIAVKHADRVIQSHFRENYSTCHVVQYNKRTGEIVLQKTSQGYNNASDWARGQAGESTDTP